MEKKTIKYILTITILLLVAFFNGEAYTSEVPKNEVISEADYKECQQLVEGFCQAWMNEQYEVMYQALSREGMGRMDKEKFIRTYTDYSAKGGKLIQCSVDETTTKEDAVLVKVRLKFEKEIPPRIVSGIHTFNMERDEGKWRIKYIMPPVKSPAVKTLPGGSHPGE